MRSLRLALLAFLALLAATGSVQAAPVFVVTGKGYGHGIGMSQYGAQGFAQHGRTYEQILEHYYRGAAVSPGAPNDLVDVLLASGRASLTVGSDAPFELAGETLPAGTYAATPLVGQVRVSGNGLTRTVASPATLAAGTEFLDLNGSPYRGSLSLASSESGTTLAALNTLTRERYLRGVVPREMPSGWLPEALKAQAVAARTYSLATGGHCAWPASRLAAAAPVLCPDTRDQVYGGQAAETAATNAAVQATARQVVRFGGGLATTYFFSTSGGKTAEKVGEWGGPAVPYLVSVEDPFDTISPHHAWGPSDAEVDCPGTAPDCVFTAPQVRSALGLSGSPGDLRVTARNASSRVAVLEATAGGGTATFTGTSARTELSLRSTWFFVGVLSLSPASPTVTHGARTTLTGLARRGGTSGWGSALLQRRPHGAARWTSIGAALPDGSWTRSVKPWITTQYRVVSGNATGRPGLVSVRTRVTFARPRAPFTRLAGSVGPARAGIAVTLRRRRADGSWAPAAGTNTGADGRFSFRVGRAGTYRARADAGPGYLAGSTTIQLPPA